MTAARAIPRIALAIPTRARRWLLVLTLLAAMLAAAYNFWFRDSSFVRVHDVTVVGLSGPEAPRLRRVLREAAIQQTTLRVDEARLYAAVASAPEIQSVRVTPDFPHGLRIDVTENHPVAALVVPGRGRVAIAANGTLMPDARDAGVPGINVKAMPGTVRPGGQARLGEPGIQRFVDVAAAAPPALLARASLIGVRRGDGVVVLIDNGPRIVFGDLTRLGDKWAAAAGVLASPDSSGAAYVDVRLPDRPVAGGLKEQQAPTSGVQGPSQTTTAAGSPAPAQTTSTTTPATTAAGQPSAAATPQQSATNTPQANPGAVQTNTQP